MNTELFEFCNNTKLHRKNALEALEKAKQKEAQKLNNGAKYIAINSKTKVLRHGI